MMSQTSSGWICITLTESMRPAASIVPRMEGSPGWARKINNDQNQQKRWVTEAGAGPAVILSSCKEACAVAQRGSGGTQYSRGQQKRAGWLRVQHTRWEHADTHGKTSVDFVPWQGHGKTLSRSSCFSVQFNWSKMLMTVLWFFLLCDGMNKEDKIVQFIDAIIWIYLFYIIYIYIYSAG